MDFKKATELFSDPDFDGEPVVIFEPGPDEPPVPPDPPVPEGESDDGDGKGDAITYVVGGVAVHIVAERVAYYGPDGALITESYRDFTRKQIRSEFSSLDEFLRRWNKTRKKQAIIDLLEENGIILENLAQDVGRDYGDFDLICHIAYDQPPLTRRERANNVKKRNYFTKYGEQARGILNALLDKYADEGITSIENPRVLNLKPFSDIGTPVEIINNVFGGKGNYDKALRELEQGLFGQEQSA
jgi:type I restriction enzyme, R subunit